MKKVCNSISRLFDNEMMSGIIYEMSELDVRAKDSVTMLSFLHLLKSGDANFTNVIEYTFGTQFYANKAYDLLSMSDISSMIRVVEVFFARDYTTFRLYVVEEPKQIPMVEIRRYYSDL